MIYYDYKVKFYRDSQTGEESVLRYIEGLDQKQKTKILKYIEFLRQQKGYLDEPYSKHIRGKIRELRVDFSKNRHRIFYFVFIKKTIILLHVFTKKSAKTPQNEIIKAETNYIDVLNNKEIYE